MIHKRKLQIYASIGVDYYSLTPYQKKRALKTYDVTFIDGEPTVVDTGELIAKLELVVVNYGNRSEQIVDAVEWYTQDGDEPIGIYWFIKEI